MTPENQQAHNPFDLGGKVALVTGGGRGIGEAIALGLARAGADLVVAARSADQIETVAVRARSLGRKALAVQADVGDLESLAELFRITEAEFGGLEILVNNAGVNRRKASLEVTPEDWDYIHNINLKGLFFACQHALKSMQRRGYGRIINIASLASFIGLKNVTVYGASKGGVGQLTKALAVEFAGSNITVNAVAPGYIYTEMTRPVFENPQTGPWVMSRIPMGRRGTPEDLVGAAVFLASPAAAYVTGHIIPVDGGWLAG